MFKGEKNICAKYLFVSMFIIYSLSPLINLIKMHRFETLNLLMLIFVYGSLIFVVISAYIYIFLGKRKHIDFYAFSFALIGFFGLLLGFTRLNSFRYQISDLFRICLVFFVYVAFFNIEIISQSIPKFIKNLAAAILYSNFFVILWIYISLYVFKIPVILRLGSSSLLLPASYYLLQKKNGHFIISVVLIVASGKRGALAALVAMLGFMAIFNFQKKIAVRPILVIFTVAICIFFVSFSSLGDRFLFASIKRWRGLIVARDITDMRIAFAGRIGEVTSSLKAIQDKKLGLLLGGGHGFEYTYEQVYGRGDDKIAYTEGFHNVHFSPIGVISVYGIAFGVIIYFLIIYKILKLKRFVCNPNLWILPYSALYYYIIGQFFYSFAAYTILQDPLLWSGIGVLSGRMLNFRRAYRLSS